MMLDAYAVSVRVSLINNVTGGLLAMSALFGRTHGQALALQAALSRIKLMMLTGAAAAGVGFLGLGMIAKTIPYGKEYLHQLEQMNAAGMQHAEILKATNAAWAMNRDIPTQTTAQSLKMVRELRAVMGSTEEALQALPTVAKLQAILSNVKGVTNAEGTAYDVAKLLDIRGKSMNAKDFESEAQLMTKAIVASGGIVTARDFFGTGKYGRTATAGWDADFMYKVLPTLIQEMKSGSGAGGAGGPGNAMMSAYATVVGGQIAQKNLGVWERLGLLDPSKIVRSKTGTTKGVLPGGVVGTELFQSNPYEWTRTILMPAMLKAGITDKKEQQLVLSRLFANRTAGFVMSQMALQPLKFEREMRNIDKAMGLEAFAVLLRSDPYMAQRAYQAQWQNLLTEIAIVILPTLVTMTRNMTNGLISMTEWMREHPKLTKALVLGFTGLAAALAFGGVVILLGAAFEGLALALSLFGVFRLAGIAAGFSQLAVGLGAIAGVSPAAIAASFWLLAGALAALVAPIALLIAGSKYTQDRDARILADPGSANPRDREALEQRLGQDVWLNKHGLGGLDRGLNALRRKLGTKEYDAEGDLAKLRAAPRPPLMPGPVSKPPPPLNPAWNGPQAIYMDGKKVGGIVAGHIANSIGGPNLVTGRPDPKASIPPTGGVNWK